MMKMTTEAAPSMDAPITGKHRQTFLRMWHAWALGAFAIAYLTAEDASYAMHRFAGYAVLAAIVIRVLATMPSLLPLARNRPPLFAWTAVAVMGGAGLAAATGALADAFKGMENLHEAVAEASLWVIVGHAAVAFALFGGGRQAAAWLSRLGGGRGANT